MARDKSKRQFSVIREGGYRYINPLLECESDRDVIRNRELRPFKKNLEAYLHDRMRYPGVEKVSIYTCCA